MKTQVMLADFMGWSESARAEYDRLTEDLDISKPNEEFVANISAAWIQYKERIK